MGNEKEKEIGEAMTENSGDFQAFDCESIPLPLDAKAAELKGPNVHQSTRWKVRHGLLPKQTDQTDQKDR